MSGFRRILVVGLDGATFDLLDRWFAAGELPFLGSMASGGVRAPLASVFPAKTIPAWYSFATGLDPGALGIFGFTEPNGGPGKSRLVQTFRPAEAVWDRLSRVGRTVGVLNFPLRAGYPLNGFFVPGMLADRAPTYPEDLTDAVEREIGERSVAELPPYRGADHALWMDQATRGADQRGRIAEILIRRFRPEFLFVLFRETDRVQHQLWDALDQPLERVPDELRRFWRTVDASVGRIDGAFRAAGGPSTTLVISDHGHGAARADFFTNRWLREEGYLRFRNGGDSLRRRLLSHALVGLDRVPGVKPILRYLADQVRTSPRFARVSGSITGPSNFEAMADDIDWETTVAFSYPVPEGIYLNRRNPRLTEAAQAAVVAEIRRKLIAYPDARIEVFTPDEIYRTPRPRHAPALLIRVDGLETETRMDFSYPQPLLRRRPSFFYGSGVHRMNGILLARGPGIAPRRYDTPFSLLDIAPTILDEMGLPSVASMTGRSLSPFLTGAPEPDEPIPAAG